MDKATFSNRLQQVTIFDRDVATRYVSNYLPESNRYLVRLNQSCDDEITPDEHVFPHEADPVAPLTAAEAVDLLCRANRVPEWIDISVERTDSEHTYLRFRRSGPKRRAGSIFTPDATDPHELRANVA